MHILTTRDDKPWAEPNESAENRAEYVVNMWSAGIMIGAPTNYDELVALIREAIEAAEASVEARYRYDD